MHDFSKPEVGPFEIAMQARELGRASMLQFLHDVLAMNGIQDAALAAAIWAFFLNHDHATSDPKLVQYVRENQLRIEGCATYIINSDRDFAQAVAYAIFLEWGWAIAYSTKERAESVLNGEGFKLLRKGYPDIARSPETLDPYRASAFFDEWTRKWNKRTTDNA